MAYKHKMQHQLIQKQLDDTDCKREWYTLKLMINSFNELNKSIHLKGKEKRKSKKNVPHALGLRRDIDWNLEQALPWEPVTSERYQSSHLIKNKILKGSKVCFSMKFCSIAYHYFHKP